MKSIVSFFDEFLRDEVNLNPTRLKVAKKGIKTMRRFLRNNQLFKNNLKEIIPQGSYRQGTIIKPFDDSDFDVDLLVLLHEFDNWEPKDYLNNLHGEFQRTEKYKGLVDKEGKSRCVTIDYANDFHIDIVPSIEVDSMCKVMNKNSNEFEKTDGDGYAQWFESKDSIASGQYLTKVARLIKYLRDSKRTFSIKSILLTSLLGRQIYESDTYRKDTYYKDLPTSLKTLFNRLNNYLQARSILTDEIVVNPVLSTEKFNRHWDQDKYSNFRIKINDYNAWVNDAYEEKNVNEAVKKWRKIFGDDFGEIQETSSSFSASSSDSQDNQEEFIDKYFLVDLDNDWSLTIAAFPCQSIGGFRRAFYRKNESLTFSVDRSNSFLPQEVLFRWKVKNSGREAKLGKDLRGRIEDDYGGDGMRKERTEYKGKHYVECYAIRDGTVIATDAIYVNVI